MELEDIIPTRPEFTLSKMGKTYTLRLPDLSDQAWVKEKYGSAVSLSDAISKYDWEKTLPFIFRLLEDKTDFLASEEEIIDDDGNKKKAMFTGPYKFLRAVQGINEIHAIMGALSKAIMLANPMIAPVLEGVAREEIEKKNRLTGGKSLISSQVNTVGHSSKSAG